MAHGAAWGLSWFNPIGRGLGWDASWSTRTVSWESTSWLGARRNEIVFLVHPDALADIDRRPVDRRVRRFVEIAVEHAAPSHGHAAIPVTLEIERYGWPRPSHSRIVTARFVPDPSDPTFELPGRPGPAGLPIHIDIGALALNTSLFGAVIAAGLMVWRGARRARRRSCSRCIACGYRLVDDAGRQRPTATQRRPLAIGAACGLVLFPIACWRFAPRGELPRPTQPVRLAGVEGAATVRLGMFGDQFLWRTDRTPWGGRPPRQIPITPASSGAGVAGETRRIGLVGRGVEITRRVTIASSRPVDPSRAGGILPRRAAESDETLTIGPIADITIHWPQLLANLALAAALGAVIGYAITGWRRPQRGGDAVRCPECGNLDG